MSSRSSEGKLAQAGVPRAIFSRAEPGILRQGDLCYAHFHQLRSPSSPQGPGPNAIASEKVPTFGEYADHPITLGGTNLQLRLWTGWVMVVEQTCELEYQEPDDSRILVAPAVFRTHWQGPQWSRIRTGATPGYVFLAAMSPTQQGQLKAKGWLPDSDAAVCLKSTSLVSRDLVAPVFGVSPQMRSALQRQLVSFWSVRGWKRSAQRDGLVGKRISEVDETAERFDGPGVLHKLALENGVDDEITVGLIFRS